MTPRLVTHSTLMLKYFKLEDYEYCVYAPRDVLSRQLMSKGKPDMIPLSDSDRHVPTPEMSRAKPASLQWEDPFLLDALLTDEERMIRDTANAYCQDKL
ncbi:MAG: hypothetical protein MK160_07170, partial [Rhodobacteraceae bacterium]|nr:hypothetical protein [Paracoccaceae bacterium]